MSQESIILFEEISSFQADTKLVVRAAVSPSPVDVPEEKNAGETGEESPVRGPDGPIEVGGVCEAKLARRQMWRTKMRTLMLLVALTMLGSLGTSLRVSRSQKTFVERDLRRRTCPRVSSTPLTFHNVSSQIFNIYN